MKSIDLKISKYRKDGAKIYTGRDVGILARNEFDLNQIEEEYEIVNILIPSDTWGINPSFFGGMFEGSIKKYRDTFTDRYKFLYTNKTELSDSLRKDISDDIEYVIRNMSVD